jgi:3-hydroxyisobutyrate dehydrogenase-like beta-hydroxyacid dehydrogenase
MDITCVGGEPGQATAIRMLRSVFMKGFLALLIETLGATHRYGVDKIVLDSLANTMANNDFLEIIRQQLAKGVISAERMTHEMEAVVQTLAEMGVPATMSAATRVTLRRCSDLGLAEHFKHETPDSLEEILDALTADFGT